jgi:TrmH family RNA methyltransferase
MDVIQPRVPAMLPKITSRRNPLVARFREIARGDDDDLLLLDGPHLVQDAVDAALRLRHVVVNADALDRPELRRLVDAMTAKGIDVAAASSMVMDAVSPLRSGSDIVALAERPAVDARRMYDAFSLVVIAAGVQDPGNLGAIVRVSEAGGATGVVAAGGSANPFGWKALRGSMASALRLPIAVHRQTAAAVDEARGHGCRIIAAVPRGGTALVDADLRGPVAIVIGGEGGGLPAAVVNAADQRVTIPMAARVESLNAAAAAAILVYEARRQRHGTVPVTPPRRGV